MKIKTNTKRLRCQELARHMAARAAILGKKKKIGGSPANANKHAVT
jgi:hypothetical protein